MPDTVTKPTLPPGFKFDPYSIEAMTNPLPFYKVLRECAPVYYNEDYDTFYLSRYREVMELLSIADGSVTARESTRTPREVLLRHNTGAPPAVGTDEPLPMHHLHDYPVYDNLRQAHSRPLRAGRVKALADFIGEQASERLDILLPRRRFDLTQQYGGIVAAATMCHLFHVPLSEAKYVLDTVNLGSLSDPDLEGESDETLVERMFRDTTAIVEPLVRQRRAEGPDGSWPLVDGSLSLELDGRKLTDREISETIVAVLIGGSETVPKVVAHGLWELERHPDQLEEVRSDLATNVPLAWREMVRLCAPAQWFMRTVVKPVVIGGREMRPGQRVGYLAASAGRDESEYGEDSEEFRWNREIDHLISFGQGQHFCVGIHLANLEGPILVEEFLRRVESYEVDAANAVRRPSHFQWGWNEMPVDVVGA